MKTKLAELREMVEAATYRSLIEIHQQLENTKDDPIMQEKLNIRCQSLAEGLLKGMAAGGILGATQASIELGSLRSEELTPNRVATLMGEILMGFVRLADELQQEPEGGKADVNTTQH